jgi:hypothetical protein
MLGDKRANENATTVKRTPALQTGRRYVSVVRVRRGRLQAYLDGELLTDLQTQYDEMSLPGFWALNERHRLGLGSHGSSTRFHAVELLDVGRPGAPVQGPVAAPVPAPTKSPELKKPEVTEF